MRAARGRPAQGVRRPVTASLVKTTARRLMAEGGTAALSLRAVARCLEVTAPAIYNYFHRLEDLITALVIDSFDSLADAMEAAERGLRGRDPAGRLIALCETYRSWVLVHPVEFELMYGRPIPGYRTPDEICIPHGRRPFLGIFRCFVEAHGAGTLATPAPYDAVTPGMAAGIATWREASGTDIPDGLVVLVTSGWARIHGMVALELHGHLQPLVGDPAAFFRIELEAFCAWLGLMPARRGAARRREGRRA